MFLLDVKDSKTHSQRDKMMFYNGIIEFVNKTTTDLLNLEKVKGCKILHRHLETKDIKGDQIIKDKVVLARSQYDLKNNTKSLYRTDQINPLFWMGDLMHFIIVKDSITDAEMMQILQTNKDAIIPNYDLHTISGYYQTDIWTKSDTEFSRIYCIPVLEQLAKTHGVVMETPNAKKTLNDKSL